MWSRTRGPEHGVRDRCSYVLEQNGIRFVMTAGLSPESEIVKHQALHGDGVKDVAFAVHDAEDAFRVAVESGRRRRSSSRSWWRTSTARS